jgi:hypothetical protein
MIDRVEERFGVKPKRLIGDTAYGTGEMVAWMVEEKAIEPHVPLWDKGERDDGTFSRSDFVFDADSNTFTCPGRHAFAAISIPRLRARAERHHQSQHPHLSCKQGRLRAVRAQASRHRGKEKSGGRGGGI